MQTIPVLFAICAILTVNSSSQPAEGKQSFWKNWPRRVQWEGKVGGESVEITITAGEFVKEDHKVEGEDGFYSKVDGYSSAHAQIRNGEMAPHITTWTVRWGGKQLKLKDKGIYTSVFLPGLAGPEANFDNAYLKHKVWVGPSEDGEELLVTMDSGSDGCSTLIASTIGKDGKMRRFSLAGRS